MECMLHLEPHTERSHSSTGILSHNINNIHLNWCILWVPIFTKILHLTPRSMKYRGVYGHIMSRSYDWDWNKYSSVQFIPSKPSMILRSGIPGKRRHIWFSEQWSWCSILSIWLHTKISNIYNHQGTGDVIGEWLQFVMMRDTWSLPTNFPYRPHNACYYDIWQNGNTKHT